MKRYLVFMFRPYEKSGGAADLVGDADTKKEIIKLITQNRDLDFGNILDIKENRVIWIFGSNEDRIKDVLKEIEE